MRTATSTAEAVFRQGYDAYQARGLKAVCPYPQDEKVGIWTAGKDAARRRAPAAEAWKDFLAREKRVP